MVSKLKKSNSRPCDPALLISGLYALAATAWVVLSDALLRLVLDSDPQRLSSLQTYKGLFFVGASALLLYALIRATRAKTVATPPPAVAAAAATELPVAWTDARAPLMIFLLLALGVGGTGYLVYNYLKRQLQHDKQAELVAIGSGKASQIADWMAERRHNAQVVARDTLLAREAARWFRAGALEDDADFLRRRLEGIREAHGFAALMLADEQGRVRLRIGEFGTDPLARELALQAIASADIVVSDLHRHGPEGAIEMNLVAPLKLGAEDHDAIVGAVFYAIDPRRYLFPLIQTWPTPSRSAETLLVRAEGNEVIYLNELRHRSDTALRLRLPLGSPRLPAALAVTGVEAVFEGADYRDVKVLAATHAVPDTPWSLVAKVDLDEIYAPIRQLARLLTALVGVLVGGAAVGVGLWWRQQHARFLAAHYRGQLERQALVQHFDYLAKYANDIILLSDEDGHIVEANDRAVASYGLSREELRGLDLIDLCAPEERRAMSERLERLEQTNGLVYELWHQRRDGERFPVETSSRFIDIEGKRFMQSIVRDISERKRTEEVLRENEERLALTVEAARIGLWDWDLRTNEAYLSPEWKRQIGYADGEIPNRFEEWESRLHPDDKARVLGLIKAYLERPWPNYEVEFRLRHKDGSYRWLLTHAKLFRDGQGTPYRMVVSHVDITQRRWMEEALRESEERFRAFMDNNPVVAFIKDELGRYIYGNKAWQTLLGMPMDQLIGKTDADLFPAETATVFKRTDALIMRGEAHVEDTESGPGPDGHRHWWATIKFPIVSLTGRRLLGGLALDITERHRSEEQTRQRQAELSHLSRLTILGEMASGLAHELSQPLTAIANYCDAALALSHAHGGPVDQVENAIEKAAQQAQRAGEIIRHLRDFVRKGTTERNPTDLNEVIHETVDFLKPEARLKGVVLRLELTDSLPPLRLDKIQIEQVLVNLLHNSIEALDMTQSETRQVTIQSCPPADGKVQVTVRDTGPGLDADLAKRVFERFHTSKPKGIGLGLSISRSIIEAHGGSLWAAPARDGAVFHFTLPVVEESAR